LKKITRALISVSDKTGLVEFAKRLGRHSVELISTGGTARVLKEAGLQVKDIVELTGFPEILGGRVKTLHPKVHGGILAIRSDSDHLRQLEERQISPIDLVVVNLYPFLEAINREDVGIAHAIENIDIGGPSMIRSAAKNFEDVTVLINPSDYAAVAEEMDSNAGSVSRSTRLRLARLAFDATARYDAAISQFLADRVSVDDTSGSAVVKPLEGMTNRLAFFAEKVLDLRYGENPHQRGALYSTASGVAGVATAEKLQGKELSYNNLIDLEAAAALVSEMAPLGGVACAIIKHTNPCGAAIAATAGEAFVRAKLTDPISAFGGIIGFNNQVDEESARAIAETFFEAIIAPDYDPRALEVLGAKKNLRIMRLAGRSLPNYDVRVVSGGLLVQDPDAGSLSDCRLKVVTERRPTDDEMDAMRFAWVIVKHVKSNAIVYAREGRLLGVGAGQMSRVDSVRFGAMKAQHSLEGCALASDAFFPFRDGIDEAARVGVKAVIQPGGSVRDQEVISAANEHGLAMVFTGMRHFKH
jgi:phosphoribosylaminoimidazolecarboxamide formyltransferase/IMP cyclohydrolase